MQGAKSDGWIVYEPQGVESSSRRTEKTKSRTLREFHGQRSVVYTWMGSASMGALPMLAKSTSALPGTSCSKCYEKARLHVLITSYLINDYEGQIQGIICHHACAVLLGRLMASIASADWHKENMMNRASCFIALVTLVALGLASNANATVALCVGCTTNSQFENAAWQAFGPGYTQGVDILVVNPDTGLSKWVFLEHLPSGVGRNAVPMDGDLVPGSLIQPGVAISLYSNPFASIYIANTKIQQS